MFYNPCHFYRLVVSTVGSEIILTTRNKEVALYADPRGVLHEPQLLTCEESWELLEKISLSGRENIGNHLALFFLQHIYYHTSHTYSPDMQSQCWSRKWRRLGSR
jgi:hypothetical protein